MFFNKLRSVVPSIIRRFVPRADLKMVERVRNNPERILLVKQAERLGNIVLLNSAISALKNRFPQSRIDLLLPAGYAPIMDNDRRINAVIPVHKKEYISRPWMILGLLRTLRARRYDIAVDCSDVNSNSSTGAAYTLLSGALVKAGWGNGGFFDLAIPKYEGDIHASDMYLRLVSGVFCANLEGGPYFEPGAIDSRADNPLIGINCGGRDEKRWPLDNFIRVGEILSEKGIATEFILGPDEDDLRTLLRNNLPSRSSLCPLIPVQELKKTFRKYSAFVTSDSGPMHVAWSLKIPVVAVFLSSEMDKFRPLSEGSVAVDGRQPLDPQRVSELALGALNARRIVA